MSITFTPATKAQAKARIAIIGPSGCGKTYTGLILATHLANGKKAAVIDTERGSASKYADEFQFDALELETFSPVRYTEAIAAAGAAGYGALLVDSLSHAWVGKEGALELVDKAGKRNQSGNSFTAWREVTPLHNELLDTILRSPCHVICTMRSKTEYIIEENEKGKKVPRKIGMAPVQRDGVEYEFDIVADMDLANNFIVSKSRCRALSGAVIEKPGKPLADTIGAWLASGETKLDKFLRMSKDHADTLLALSLDCGWLKPGQTLAQFPDDMLPKDMKEFKAIMAECQSREEAAKALAETKAA